MIRNRVGFVVLVVLALTMTTCSASAGESTAAVSYTPSTAGASRASWITGNWVAHTLRLTIDRTGRGRMTWRTYRTCGQDPPPCDTFRANYIIDGGRAVVTFAPVGRTAATGRVISSTDTTELPIGPLRLRFDPKHDLLYMQPSPRLAQPLCGPQAPAVRCG